MGNALVGFDCLIHYFNVHEKNAIDHGMKVKSPIFTIFFKCQMCDTGNIQVSFAERQSEMPQSSRSGIPVIIDDPDAKRPVPGIDVPDLAKALQQLLVGENAPAEGVFKPEFLRLVPPLHDPRDELTWMSPMEPLEHKLVWDPTLCHSDAAGSEAKRLMSCAFRSALTQQEQQKLLDELAADPKLVYHIGLSPSKILFCTGKHGNVSAFHGGCEPIDYQFVLSQQVWAWSCIPVVALVDAFVFCVGTEHK
ncbi:hypothetical protein HPB48_002077 [Haemaphysalis longicornis]|uniref:CCR4-NOT transcription complex subunit 11 n=1 Tax=Haemaphysalis longicornis TaxID=44386 RepID=A0A9J6FGM0_HAELO|nr:hypothetical protein HPB48_002077 [Haemaphysalis longicornis]